jgi:hypothetical protein
MNPYTNVRTTKITARKINTLKKYFGIDQLSMVEYMVDTFYTHMLKCHERHHGKFKGQMWAMKPKDYFGDKLKEKNKFEKCY